MAPKCPSRACVRALLLPLAVAAATLLLLLVAPVAAGHQLQEVEGANNDYGSSSGSGSDSTRLPMVDVWEADTELRMFKRLRERAAGDHQPLLEILGLGEDNAKELEEMWADPDIAQHILTTFPMFRAFEGVATLADKAAREGLTPEDGLQALGAFRAFAKRAVERMGAVTDPTRLAETMQVYSELMESDDAFRELGARVEAGDKEAAFAIHNRVTDDIWGGTVDLHQMGLDGTEPAATAVLRALTRETEPALWGLITQDDPLITKMMEDPTWTQQLAEGLEDKSPV